jgi:hypothetical protein
LPRRGSLAQIQPLFYFLLLCKLKIFKYITSSLLYLKHTVVLLRSNCNSCLRVLVRELLESDRTPTAPRCFGVSDNDNYIRGPRKIKIYKAFNIVTSSAPAILTCRTGWLKPSVSVRVSNASTHFDKEGVWYIIEERHVKGTATVGLSKVLEGNWLLVID